MGIMSGKYQPGAASQMRLIHVPSVSVSVSVKAEVLAVSWL